MTEIHAITMPKWGLAMTEGAVACWNLEEGAAVEPGAELLDIETSKITNALEAQSGGVLRRRVAAEGQTLPVGALLGVIADPSVGDAEVEAFIEGFAAEAEAMAEVAAVPEPETAEVAGRTWKYLRTGPEGDPPIVLLHGFGGDLNNWMFNQPALAEAHDTVAVDLPGHGGTGKAVDGGGVEWLAAGLAEFLSGLGIERAHLVGHSLGGAVAIALALEQPDRVASLTLVCPAGLGAEIDHDYIVGFIEAGRRKDLKPQLEKLFADGSLVTRDLVEDVLKFKRLDGVDAALRAIAAACFAGGRQQALFRDRLGGIAAPVQVIWGSADRIVPAAHADGLPDGIAVHRVAAGHMAHMESAGDVNRLIEAFVQG